MAQENINFGAYPNDINSDAIRTAFEKAQNNFSELYGITTSFGVQSIVPGTGITVSAPSGDVTLNANIFNIQLRTQSLVLGPSAFVSTSGPNSTVTITNSGTPITIEMPANISGTSLSVTGNVTAGNLVTSNVTINTEIISTGNVTAPNFIGNVIGNISGNITAPGSNTQVIFNDNNLTNGSSGFTFNKSTNAVSVTGNITGGNVIATLHVGNLSGTGNSNVGNLGTTGLITATGNITGGNVIATLHVGNLSGTGNSNVGNLGVTGVFSTTLSASANANVGNIGATRGVFSTIVGTLETAAQPNITSTGTLTSLSVSGNSNVGNLGTTGLITATGNITGGNMIATLHVGNLSGTGNSNVGNIGATNFVGSGALLTSITGANVTGTVANATYAVSAGSATTAGTVTTAAQGNITSVGILTSLSVSGNINAGNVIATHFGSGAGLSSITGANVTGTVANATYAVSAGSATTATSATTAGTATSATTAGTVTTNAQPNITSLGTLSSLSVTGNINTGNVRTDGYFYANGVAVSFGYSNTNVASYLPTFTGTVGATTLTTGANTTAGTITGNWTLSAGSKLQATYADLAEYYEADYPYDPGTVLMFGGNNEVTIADIGTTKVAGVVSTNPAYVMNSGCTGDAVALALQGRVPTKVKGNVNKGDMMVSGGQGYAVSSSQPVLGSVIGKSLENFTGTEGIIEIVVGRL